VQSYRPPGAGIKLKTTGVSLEKRRSPAQERCAQIVNAERVGQQADATASACETPAQQVALNKSN